MKNTTKKIISGGLAVSMILGFGVSAVSAQGETVRKNETVFALLSGDGEVKDTTVSVHLESDENLKNVKDVSDLKNIVNLKGKEKPVINNNEVTWDVESKNLFYQGKSDKKLPLKFNITYELDGVKVKENELNGKTGHLKLKYSVENLDKHTKTIRGETKDIYVPYMVATVFIFDSQNSSNIKASEGKILTDGKKTEVAYLSFPGLKETIGRGNENFDISKDLPNSEIVIELDIKDYKLRPIMAIASEEFPEIKSLKDAKSLDELNNSLNDLKDGGNKLLDGAATLKDGQSRMSDAIIKFVDGFKELDNGAKDLENGMSMLKNKSKELVSGADSLNKGSEEFSKNVFKLSNGIKMYSNGVDEYIDKSDRFNQSISPLIEGISQLSENLNKATEGSLELSKKYMEFSKGVEKALITIYENIGLLNQNAIKINEKTKELGVKLSSIPQKMNTLNNGVEGIKNTNATVREKLGVIVNSMPDGAEKVKMTEILKVLEKENQIIGQLSNGIKSFNNELNPQDIKKLTDGINEFTVAVNKLAGSKNETLEKIKKILAESLMIEKENF